MMDLSRLLTLFDELPAHRALAAAWDQHGAGLLPAELTEPVRPPWLARLFTERARPLLLIVGRVEAVPIWQQLLESWLPPGTEILRFPEPTPLPYDRGPWSPNSRNGRLTVMTRLLRGQHPLLPAPDKPFVVIGSARAVMHRLPPRRRFLTALRVVRVGQVIELKRLLSSWEEAGYERVSVVESVGQFSARGGIIDIFPVAATHPARIELFGDEVDTLRAFDPATQRTVTETIERVIVPPAREVLPLDAAQVALEWLDFELERMDDLPSWQDDIPELASGLPSPHLEYYLPLVYPQAGMLLDYLPETADLVVEDWPFLLEAVRDLEGQAAKMRDDQDSLPPGYGSPLWGWDRLAARLTERPTLVLGNIGRAGAPEERSLGPLGEQFAPGPRYGGQARPFVAHLRRAVDMRQRTVVVSRQASRLAELWRNEIKSSAIFTLNGVPAPVEVVRGLPEAGEVIFVRGSIPEGFVVEDDDGDRSVLLNLFTDAEIFGWQRPTPRRRREARQFAPEAFYADISPGDHVVHLDYGVGQFIGLVSRQIGGERREYLQLRYRNDDALYVPVHHADRLSKWIGPEEQSPQLHRIGGNRWQRARESARKAIDEMADELLELYAARETIAGHAYRSDSEWQAEMEAAFPYLETEDQLRAIAAVKQDMESPRPMDRLICGDVGYGKTEVALRAAFKAVMDGKQVAMLVPTTVLAQQHYRTFRERLEPFPVNIGIMSRLQTARQQHETIKGMREGEVDIVVGTHRLLSADVSYKDLGLLIIDEEQRFGVSHKETLKQLRREVDVLTLTATPIPRTLYMGLSGLRDISQIQTPPSERLPVQTYVGRADDKLIRRAILRELDRGGQIYFVHNRVQTIRAMHKKLSQLVPEASIAIAHGQMPERQLESAMGRFAQGEVDLLLCTSIIESGLDIPNANTLIVDRAELFGLSQLYQLRGRVGRAAQRAYAYFFHSAWRQLTADAQARLETIAEQTDLGAGYEIAMRDLEIRGAGDLLGSEQSGHISAVGFDLYTRMLSHAVRVRRAQQRGERPPTEPSLGTHIDLPLPTYVPEDYVADGSLRLRLYRRMAQLVRMKEIDEMAAELADRFGPIPDPVDNLLFQLRVKVLAGEAGVSAVSTERGQIQLRLAHSDDLPTFRLQRFLANEVRVSRRAIWIPADDATVEWRVRLVQVLERLAQFEFDVPDTAAPRA